MQRKLSMARFEGNLEGMSGNISLYRKGINKHFLTVGFPMMHDELEQVRKRLEAIGMYEQCRDALIQTEALVRKGPEHDEDAYTLMLTMIRALMQASGSHEAMRRRYSRSGESTDKGQSEEKSVLPDSLVERSLLFIGSSRKDLQDLPASIPFEVRSQLYAVQLVGLPSLANRNTSQDKPATSIKLAKL